MTSEIEAEIAAMRVSNDAMIVALADTNTRLRKSRDQLLKAAKKVTEVDYPSSDYNDPEFDEALRELSVAIIDVETLP